ncbi:MAG: selenite/tellurite reduction operon c-type cytochrome lipoprotein ExtS [Desulfuromonadaceae bacterium]|nr:selenite/tellurite reduction operon c-type cytochrome lipoprotein ExtS [Desulfuromonadaceae bacterium]
MVSRLLAAALLVVATPVWGGQPHQFCLSCHPAHYEDRGRCSDCHRGNPSSDRKNIAHSGLRAGKYACFTLGDTAQIKEGQLLMDQLACRRCHVSAGRGNRLAVSLDSSAVRKTAGELASSIRHPVANMPNFSLEEEQITMLVNTILAGAQGRKTTTTAPVRVHFNTSGKKSVDIFSTKCGSCHRILSERSGALGTGDIGPNLSGILSENYPKTFRNGELWNRANLKLWLKNPREIRPWARMQPVILTEKEMKELESIIVISSDPNM